MSFRLLRQLARLPRRHRPFYDPFYDPFFYPPEIYHPTELRYPMYRLREMMDEMEEMMDMFMEPERYIDIKESKKPALEQKGSEAKAEETKTATREKESTTQEKESKPQTVQAVTRAKRRDSLSFFDDEATDKVFGRAQQIFEQASKEEKPALTLDENDELLKSKEEFEEIRKFFKNQGMDFTGSHYQSSTIFKDGKMVTVAKHAKLNPDGTVKTEVVQEYKDNKGQKDSRKWMKEDKIAEELENKTEETKKEETKKEEIKEQTSTEASATA